MSATQGYAVWPDPRSKSRSWRSGSCNNGQFQSLFPPPSAGMHAISLFISVIPAKILDVPFWVDPWCWRLQRTNASG